MKERRVGRNNGMKCLLMQQRLANELNLVPQPGRRQLRPPRAHVPLHRRPEVGEASGEVRDQFLPLLQFLGGRGEL
eukprot:757480-Hanusia_phi.AAC.5